VENVGGAAKIAEVETSSMGRTNESVFLMTAFLR